MGEAKWLKTWSGRPDSNRRRPAWESPRRLHIKDMASTAAIQIHGVSATYLHSFLSSPLMEWKWSGRIGPESNPRHAIITARLPAPWNQLISYLATLNLEYCFWCLETTAAAETVRHHNVFVSCLRSPLFQSKLRDARTTAWSNPCLKLAAAPGPHGPQLVRRFPAAA